MSNLESASDVASLEREVRARRLWYHDIELRPGLRTRFPEDYDISPVLRRVDEGNAEILGRLDGHLPSALTGLRVLDLGCADGLYTLWAARRGARRVVAIERNRHNFERAMWLRQTLGQDHVELHWGSIERHCSAASFDLVFCVGLVYHLVDPLGAMHLVRTRCAKTLVFSSALDLPDGDGAPMSRLDRYVTGAHGVWSFNAPMVRQLLATAGFDIAQEVVAGEDASRLYFAIATPGEFTHHHIFEDTVDQEFPINIEQRRKRVRAAWRELADCVDRPIALFGAGTHTPWLLEQVADIPGVEVACVLDDRVPPSGLSAGLPVSRPTDVDPETFSALVLSSWHQSGVLFDRATRLFGDRVRIVSLH